MPVTVIVDEKRDIEAELTDNGFKPPVIRIDEGTAIQWKWSGCEVARVITEATYSHRTGQLHAVESDDRYRHSSCVDIYRLLLKTFSDQNYNFSEKKLNIS